MKIQKLVSAFAVVSMLSACGSKDSSSRNPEDLTTEDEAGDYTKDASAIGDYQEDLMDEITSALDESGSGGAESLSLAGKKIKTVKGRDNSSVNRECEENTPDAGKVTVAITYTNGITGSITRVWQPKNTEDALCRTNGSFAFKNLGKSGDDIDQLSMTETVDLTRPNVTVKGTRSTTFSDSADTSYTYEKTVDVDSTRTRTVTKKDGSSTTRTIQVTTPTKLLVKVKRNATTGELEEKIIATGQTQRTIAASKTEITNTFENLKFDLTGNDDTKCIPVSGTQSGETKKDGTVVENFAITFGADKTQFPSGISIKVGDAAAVDCPKCAEADCDFKPAK